MSARASIAEYKVDLGGGRSARAFSLAPVDALAALSLQKAARFSFADAEDEERLALIRKAFEDDFVQLDAHEGLDPVDVWGLYLRTGSERLFLTKLIPRTRVARMLDASPVVLETATMEVCDDETPKALREALDRWIARVMPGASPFYELNVDGEADTHDAWVTEVDVPLERATHHVAHVRAEA